MSWLRTSLIALAGVAGVLLAAHAGATPVTPISPSNRKMHLLRKGSAGPEVAIWRNVIGASPGNEFDDETVADTKAWQSARGLTPDAIVGHDSWTAAGYEFESTPAASNGPPKPKPVSAQASAGQPSPSTGGGGVGGHAWARALPLESVMAQGAILQAAHAGQMVVSWTPLTLKANGHELTIDVMSRALRIGNAQDSVAIIATYQTEQILADMLDAYMLTPHVADAIFQAADVRILPYPNRNSWVTDGTMGHTDRMIEHSDAMDAKGVLLAKLAANEGKHWLISKRIWTDPEPKKHNGPNYGFFDSHGVPAQDVGMVHNMKHSDYSQKVVLMKRRGKLDGKDVDLRDIARDPTLHVLLSDEGPLPDLVHPDLGGAAA